METLRKLRILLHFALIEFALVRLLLHSHLAGNFWAERIPLLIASRHRQKVNEQVLVPFLLGLEDEAQSFFHLRLAVGFHENLDVIVQHF